MLSTSLTTRAAKAARNAARSAILAGAGLFAAAGAAHAASAVEIEHDVAVAKAELVAVLPEARKLFDEAEAVLIIPKVTKAGVVVGGAYGEGALQVGGVTDSYWSYGAASLGYQIGVQQTRQAMFFMTDAALSGFLADNGFELGADAEVTLINDGAELSVDTTKNTKPIIVVVYGRDGLLAGASVQGGKYSRIDR